MSAFTDFTDMIRTRMDASPWFKYTLLTVLLLPVVYLTLIVMGFFLIFLPETSSDIGSLIEDWSP